MKKIIIGLVVGMVAGIIDLIPMILQQLPLDANISAFSMWMIIGIFIATTDYKIISGLKGIAISLLILFPSAVLIGFKEPFSLVPISIMTIFLGAFLGITIEAIKRKYKL